MSLCNFIGNHIDGSFITHFSTSTSKLHIMCANARALHAVPNTITSLQRLPWPFGSWNYLYLERFSNQPWHLIYRKCDNKLQTINFNFPLNTWGGKRSGHIALHAREMLSLFTKTNESNRVHEKRKISISILYTIIYPKRAKQSKLHSFVSILFLPSSFYSWFWFCFHPAFTFTLY